MANTPETTPDKEVNKSTEAPAESKDIKKEVTVGEVVQQESEKNEKSEPQTIGLDKFLELKRELKENKKLIKDLEGRLASGESADEISSDIDAIADEYPDVSKTFLKKLVGAIKKESDKSFEEKYAPKLKSIEDKERSEKIDKVFSTHFEEAMKSMKEYEGIVNPEVIKALSLNPANSKKTFTQLIEETYGKAISGKRSIESARPRGGKEPEGIDFSRARRDPSYLKEILSDPDLKKEYNKDLTNRIGL